MMSKAKISIKMTGSVMGLYPNELPEIAYLGFHIYRADRVPHESTSMMPLPATQFIYTEHAWSLKSDKLNGMIINTQPEHNYFQENGTKRISQTLLATTMAKQHAWITLIDRKPLNNFVLCENFILCMTLLCERNSQHETTLIRHTLINFYRRYKRILLTYDQPSHRKIEPFITQNHKRRDLDTFFIIYCKQLMSSLQQPISHKNHVNVMMNIQGCLNHHQIVKTRNKLCGVIEACQ